MLVGLVHPYLPEAWQKNRLKFRESLALGYLTAALSRAGFEVADFNAELLGWGPASVAEALLATGDRLGLVGISAKSQRTYRAAKEIAAIVKRSRPDVHVTVGGVFPSAADQQVLEDCQDIDSIVRGEGEYAIVELAARLASGQGVDGMMGITYREGELTRRAGARPRIRDLDALAFPARRDLARMIEAGDRGRTSAYLVASRGCYAACTFCSIHQIYGDHNVVRRSPESIVAEMRHVADGWGVSRFSFVDDLFIMPSPSGIQWVHDFCDLIEAEQLEVNFYAEMRADTIEAPLVNRLVKAGMHRLFLGVESGVDSVLVRWDKGTTVADNDNALRELRKIGLPPHTVNFGYIMFDPEMTYAELKQQYTWIRDSGFAKVQHLQNKMNIYWGTPQYRRMIEQGRTDTAPLGDRWVYEFDDPKVGKVERAVRAFLRRFEESDASLALLDAREQFMNRVHLDRFEVPLPGWLQDVVNQALRRIDGAERALYFDLFETLCALLDADDPAEDFEEEYWNSALPAMGELAREARLLSATCLGLPATVVLDRPPDGAPETPSAWLETGPDGPPVGHLVVSSEAGLGHYRAVVGAGGYDRYDHACTVDFATASLPTDVRRC